MPASSISRMSVQLEKLVERYHPRNRFDLFRQVIRNAGLGAPTIKLVSYWRAKDEVAAVRVMANVCRQVPTTFGYGESWQAQDKLAELA